MWFPGVPGVRFPLVYSLHEILDFSRFLGLWADSGSEFTLLIPFTDSICLCGKVPGDAGSAGLCDSGGWVSICQPGELCVDLGDRLFQGC